MLFAILTLLSALSVAGVAAYYSIIGLTALFAGAFFEVALMGSVLEASKLILASWIYRNWNTAAGWMKLYFPVALFVLMFITSLGIFGFLSKAHLEHGRPVAAIELQMKGLDDDIALANQRKIDLENQIADLEEDKVDASKAIDVRKGDLEKSKQVFQNQIIAIENEIATYENDKERLIADKDALKTDRIALENRIAVANEGYAADRARNIITKTIERENADRIVFERDAKAIDDRETGFNERIEDIADKITNANVRIAEVNEKISEIDVQITGLSADHSSEDSQIKQLRSEIASIPSEIRTLTASKNKLQNEIDDYRTEIGPLIYVAELIYPEDGNERENINSAVRILIIIIIFVFDPLAVGLVVAANMSLLQHSKSSKLARALTEERIENDPVERIEPTPKVEPVIETKIKVNTITEPIVDNVPELPENEPDIEDDSIIEEAVEKIDPYEYLTYDEKKDIKETLMSNTAISEKRLAEEKKVSAMLYGPNMGITKIAGKKGNARKVHNDEVLKKLRAENPDAVIDYHVIGGGV